MDVYDKIMDLAESEHDIALAALQEALSLMTDAQQRKVLEYLESEEQSGSFDSPDDVI